MSARHASQPAQVKKLALACPSPIETGFQLRSFIGIALTLVDLRQAKAGPAIVRRRGKAAADNVETYWHESALWSALTDAGWIVSKVRRCIGKPDDRWLSVRASRA